MQFELLGRCGSNALRMAHAWYEKDRQNTWQRFLEVSAVMDSMKLVNRTFNQNPYQKGVKVGSRVLMPLIEGLYRPAVTCFRQPIHLPTKSELAQLLPLLI
jgi:hyaluronoglucosaminidase